MFTGIIEGFGTISGIKPSGQSRRMAINADYELDNTKIGDSIAVNGACLTVVSFSGKRFEVDVSPETVAKTTLGKAKIGDRLNLERALCISDRIDGHLVSGHIDGIGKIKSRKTEENAIIITFNIPESVSYYIIKKGSVAVDGISLTVNECDHESFQVSIIPHTAKLTTLGFKKISDSVNVETDMIGKYVERFVTQTKASGNEKKTEKSSVDMQLLARTGFI
ncbi:MAG: riboflavin synthase [Desulfobacterales bacterium]|nr:riboflavin synthase [Desulfobacterales bacterium]MDX2508829.1 riboflavin synthase [Desulfobacterales bacterium]